MIVGLSVLIIILTILLLPYLIVGLLLFTLGRTVKLKKDYTQKPTVTVLLPTYNEEELIEKKLDNLLEQTYPIHEILIYDCSTDKTPAIIQKKYSKKNSSIKLIRQPVRIGKARTLNLAFIDATGEILITTDCDTFLKSREAISELVANFGDKRVGGVNGVFSQKGIEKLHQRFQKAIQILETNLDSAVIGHGQLCAYRMSLVEPVDVNSMAEDTEENVLIRRQGHKVIVDPSLIATEEKVPNEFTKRRMQKDRRAQGVVKVLLRNKSLLLNPRFGLYGLIVFPLELFILAFSPFLLMGLGIVLVVLLYTIHPIVALALVATFILAFVHKSNMIAAIIDTELSGLIGTLMSLAKKDNPLWTKVR